MELKNKIVVITGATGGIGSEIADSLSQEGAILMLVGRSEKKLIELNKSLGNGHHIAVCDLSLPEGRKKLITECENLPCIDILINNAGISCFSLLEDILENELLEIINTNLVSPMLVTKSMLPLLQKGSEKTVINIGSTFGSIGYPGFSAYCASKFGLRGFTEAISRELSDDGIRALYFAPRATKTSINTDAVNKMNLELGNQMDEPKIVAQEFMGFIKSNKLRVYLGWPEKLFVKINAILPGIVDSSLSGSLSVIKKYAKIGQGN